MKVLGNSIFTFTLLLSAIVLGAKSVAADLPKEFPFSVTYTNSGTANVVQQGNDSARTIDYTLIAKNDAGKGFLHDLTAHCVGMSYHDRGEPPKGGGACTFTDPDGDQLFERWTFTKPGGGAIQFIGGTGKYSGIECQGEWEGISRSKALYESTWQGTGKKRGTCKLP